MVGNIVCIMTTRTAPPDWRCWIRGGGVHVAAKTICIRAALSIDLAGGCETGILNSGVMSIYGFGQRVPGSNPSVRGTDCAGNHASYMWQAPTRTKATHTFTLRNQHQHTAFFKTNYRFCYSVNIFLGCKLAFSFYIGFAKLYRGPPPSIKCGARRLRRWPSQIVQYGLL